jgi:hypothetical protein
MAVLLPAATWVGACTDFATPAQLAAPTIIAVVAAPPIVAPGQQTEVSVVVAGPDGRLMDLTPRWTLVESFPTVPPMGTLLVEGDVATYQAPEQVPPRPEDVPPVDTLRLEVDVPDGDGGTRTLAAVKAIAVLAEPTANPTLTILDGDGAEVSELRASPGEALALSLGVAPAPTASARYAWYATLGEIEDYQSSPTELVAPAEPGAGEVFAVVRDGVGGVAWRAVPFVVE